MLTTPKLKDDSPLDIKEIAQWRSKKANGPKPPAMLPSKVVFLEN